IIGGAMLIRWIVAAACAVALLSAETAGEWLRQGRTSKAKGDTVSALAAFERAQALDPNSAEIEDEIGFLLAAVNRGAEAAAHFERAIAVDPNWAPAHYHLGVALWLAENPDRSVPELEMAVRLRPRDAEYRYH